AGYLAIAGGVAFYLLPVGFELDGAALLLAQLATIVAGAVLVATSTFAVVQHRRRRANLAAIAQALGWTYRADIGDRIWGGSIDEQIDRG
ncbi:hypothetical protein SB773_32155, partial [Bacillus sp. SIMBA_074]|uniref:hypothetical protein n=1 Tax=Bacillus sp. SIMBA_074 TaxID=3085812 RepID=UPI003978F0F8